MIPFQYHPIENFPVDPELGREWASNKQMILQDETIGEDAQSVIKFVGISTYKNYFKFNVRHETLKECWVRIDKQDRKRAIFVEEFDLFMPPNSSYVLIKSSHKIGMELLKRIKDCHRQFTYTQREIDLGRLKADLHPQVKGGWFKELEIEEVSTAAIFGANVSESDEWDRYETLGTLASLVIEFKHAGAMHSVNISASGAITLYSNYNELYAIGLVERFNNVVRQFETEVKPITRQKGSKKTM
jgi:hypothetical protein